MSKIDKLQKQYEEGYNNIDNSIKEIKKLSDKSKRVSAVAENASIIIDDIDRKFADVTKFNDTDIAFLFFATALQCVRQYVLTPFQERLGHEKSAANVHEKEADFFDKFFDDVDPTNSRKYYFASLGDIIDITRGVPYDAIFGSKDFDMGGIGKGLNGNSHRFRTLGHDPLLGWVFGTSNILTNTLTDWRFMSYHVKSMPKIDGIMMPKITENANTLKVFDYVNKRIHTEPQAVAAAVIKQRFHIKSDEFSKVGLPVPVLQTISPEVAQKLAEFGIDYGNVKIVVKQASFSIIINALIKMIHGMYYDETKFSSYSLYEVKTRNIIRYSNAIASMSNIIIVAIGTSIGSSTSNTDMMKKSLTYLDVGGIMVTIYKLVNDHNFIKQIKQEFLEKEFYNTVMNEI